MKANGPAEHPRLHHVNLKTSRLNEMIAWYATVVGTKAMFQFPGGAFLSNDEANHRIALITSPRISDDPEKIVHAGMHHMAFEFSSMDGLLDNYVRLKNLNIIPHLMLDHGITTSFYYVDPDGNSVELQCDNFGSWEQSRKWIQTSTEFASNPIGVPVDPQKMVDARSAGAAASTLHKRAYAGEFVPNEPMDPRIPLD